MTTSSEAVGTAAEGSRWRSGRRRRSVSNAEETSSPEERATRAAPTFARFKAPRRCSDRWSSGTLHTGHKTRCSSSVRGIGGSAGCRSDNVNPLKGRGTVPESEPRRGRGCDDHLLWEVHPTGRPWATIVHVATECRPAENNRSLTETGNEEGTREALTRSGRP